MYSKEEPEKETVYFTSIVSVYVELLLVVGTRVADHGSHPPCPASPQYGQPHHPLSLKLPTITGPHPPVPFLRRRTLPFLRGWPVRRADSASVYKTRPSAPYPRSPPVMAHRH